MDNKTQVSRSRQKRTQKRTRDTIKKEPLITSKLVLCYLLLLVGLLFVLNIGRGIIVTDLTPGQLAPTTLQAEIDFETIDLLETDLKRERISATIHPIAVVRAQPLNDALRTLSSFLDMMQAQPKKETPPTEVEDKPVAAKQTPPAEANLSKLGLPETLKTFPEQFPPAKIQQLGPLLKKELQSSWNRGILSAENRDTAFQGGVPQKAIQLGLNGMPRALEDFPIVTEAARRLAERVSTQLELTRIQQDLIRVLAENLLAANIVIDPVASREFRDRKASEVAPVMVLRREKDTLIEAREVVTPQVMQDLRTQSAALLEREKGNYNFSRLFGQSLYLAVGLAMSLAFLYLLENPSFKKTNRLFLWVVLTMLSMMLGQFLIYLSANLNLFPGHLLRSLLPLALAPMLGTILYGPRLGLAVGVSSSLAHAMQHDMDLTIFFCGIAVTITSSISVRAIHKRSNLFRAGLWIGGVKALVMMGAGSLELIPWMSVAQQSVIAFGEGLFAAFLVLLLISPFEYLFKVTTDIRLLELSDMGHPLLSRLAMEAPGTYHHSLMVAHLAQAAAREIGANDMLVRVCAYYHDIGKLTKPEFFIENGQGRQNPHDDLSPSMSRLLIISHVKEGVSLARRYKLPALIVDGIEQHHGTSVIQYFYHRARTRAEESGNEKVKAEDYRYPGPKPRTSEMGILMMADAIEAASRTIDKNKPGQLEGLVNEIIREKVNDGQFDQCRLTMEEINAARRSFIFSLRNMLHGRVEYPKDNESDSSETKESSASKPKPEPDED